MRISKAPLTMTLHQRTVRLQNNNNNEANEATQQQQQPYQPVSEVTKTEYHQRSNNFIERAMPEISMGPPPPASASQTSGGFFNNNNYNNNAPTSTIYSQNNNINNLPSNLSTSQQQQQATNMVKVAGNLEVREVQVLRAKIITLEKQLHDVKDELALERKKLPASSSSSSSLAAGIVRTSSNHSSGGANNNNNNIAKLENVILELTERLHELERKESVQNRVREFGVETALSSSSSAATTTTSELLPPCNNNTRTAVQPTLVKTASTYSNSSLSPSNKEEEDGVTAATASASQNVILSILLKELQQDFVVLLKSEDQLLDNSSLASSSPHYSESPPPSSSLSSSSVDALGSETLYNILLKLEGKVENVTSALPVLSNFIKPSTVNKKNWRVASSAVTIITNFLTVSPPFCLECCKSPTLIANACVLLQEAAAIMEQTDSALVLVCALLSFFSTLAYQICSLGPNFFPPDQLICFQPLFLENRIPKALCHSTKSDWKSLQDLLFLLIRKNSFALPGNWCLNEASWSSIPFLPLLLMDAEKRVVKCIFLERLQYAHHLIVQFGGDCLPYLESNDVLCSVIDVLFYCDAEAMEVIRVSLFVLHAFMGGGDDFHSNKEYGEFLRRNSPISYKRMILSLLKTKEACSVTSFEFGVANEILASLEGDEEYVEEDIATNSQEREILMEALQHS